MPVAARWIRLHPSGMPAMQAACAGFTRAQGADAAPSVLWASLAGSLTGVRHAVAVAAPLKYVPGRGTRWGPVLGVIAALMIGATALMATIAYGGQRFFEWQIETSRRGAV